MVSPTNFSKDVRTNVDTRRRALPDRLRLLVTAPFTPRTDASHGGRVTAALLARLAEQHEVALVCLRRHDEPPTGDVIRARCAHVEEVRWAPPPATRLWRTRAAALRKLVGAPPDLVAQTFVPAYAERLRSLAEAFQPHLVHVELHEMGQYLPALDTCPAPRLLVDHDPGVSSARELRRASRGVHRISRGLDEYAWRRFSRQTLAAVNAVVVFTERDAEALRAVAPEVRIHRIPFVVELPVGPLDPRGGDPPTLLFFGGFEHPPNADAARRLSRSIFPRLRPQHPELVLELVGKGPADELMALAGDSIVVAGEVPSIAPYLAHAAVVAAPLRLGGGMRVKVLETLAAGKALVASTRALEGLQLTDGREVLIADSDEEFCAAISELLASEERRVALGRCARDWAEANLDSARVAAAYEALYRQVLAANA